MDDHQIQTLFQNALLDPKFRKAVTRDPVQAFAALGIELASRDVPRGGAKLPPPKAILRAWEKSVGDCRLPRIPITVFLPACESDPRK
jgi:hypothetical protein